MTLLEQFSRELEDLVARAAPSVVGIAHPQGHGTGVVLADDGYVITNAHVVRPTTRNLRVHLARGDQLKADVVGVDRQSDLAVLRISARGLPSLPLADNRKLKVGQLVVAIGNPFRFDRSVSIGVVSALDRSLPGPDRRLFEGLIQTDAAINPGNSGGPLVDASGSVVGINTAVIPFAQGIGFAIPAHTASWVAAVLIQRGEIRRPFLGIVAQSEELSPLALAQSDQARAVRIYDVRGDSPAQAAGLKMGDLLLSANGTPTATVDDLQRVMVLSGAPELELHVLRDGERKRFLARPSPDADPR
jgi:S1-C subfamily serine protease